MRNNRVAADGATGLHQRSMTNWLLYLATVLIWGSSWLGIKLQLGHVAPEVSVVYRFAIAALLMLSLAAAAGRSLRFPWRTHLGIAMQGVPLFSINYLLFYVATAHLPSGLVAVIFSTIVAWNIVFGALLLGLQVRARAVAGAAMGVVGLGLIFAPDLLAIEASRATLVGLALAFVATVIASLGNIAAIRNQRAGVPVLEGTAIGMAYGALFSLLVCWVRGLAFDFDLSLAYVGSLAYLAIFASVIAFWCYLTLLGRIGPDRGAYAAVMFPVVALALSTAFEDFVWTWPALAGVALVLAGNVVALAKTAARAPAPARA